jgi:apolipoprotein N-acyltransferase
MQMDDLKEKTAGLADHVEDLANTFYQLTVVNLTQKATNIASGLILVLAVGMLGFCILLFLGFALSWWLGNLMQNRAIGFLLGAGFFMLILLIIASLRKKIIFPYIRNFIIRKML